MLYVISGCSCGGKTSLINALGSRGYNIAHEPGRDVVRQELDSGGNALPWRDPAAFAMKCIALSVERYAVATRLNQPVFLDRSLVDAICALEFCAPSLAEPYMGMIDEYRYASTVFMAAPWSEIFTTDAERRNTFEDAVAEYDRLVEIYALAGYSIQTLPQISVRERIAFVLTHMD